MTRKPAEPIYDILREKIISGDFVPGAPLRQDEIARNHGTSKIPVREALLKLEVDGFVTFRKNRGAIVRELSTAEILHLTDIRVALECRAIELAMPNMIEADFETAEHILEDYARQKQTASWSALNIQFHRTLYEPSGNAVLLQLIADIQQRIGPNLRQFVTEISGLERPHSEHRLILAACREGDIPAAVALLRDHILTTKKEIAARLRRHEESVS
ncbi:GntR family transcriptional regulator [Pseudorhodobacter sp.]|uniref:GntR family transcriptional regulator n=1 Tax=Pseudorhodobacter sp. TaxID=1934400 RepID=UPI002AFE97D6|nr:GntR family transcriptional regulator [Pseudorhodobacter sp.]